MERTWLVYSKNNDAVYFFKLFSNNKIELTEDGYNDWENISCHLLSLDCGPKHYKSVSRWAEFKMRLNKGRTIDKQNQKIINAETVHWRNVFERLLAIIQFLAQHNSGFSVLIRKG